MHRDRLSDHLDVVRRIVTVHGSLRAPRPATLPRRSQELQIHLNRQRCGEGLGEGLSFIRKSSGVVLWSEGGPGDREVGHATKAGPNGLRARWMVRGSVIVST